MKKIIVGFLSLLMVFVGQSAYASTSTVSWNTLSNDCSTIAIANDTQHTGFGSPCWGGTNISANAGDFVKVRVYYHNTGTTTANNTNLKIIKSGGSSNYTFSGQIVSSSGNLYSSNPSSVSLSIPSNQTLNFIRTEWYPNQSTQTQYPHGATLLSGQSGSEILGSSGLYIGNIAAASWTTQGTAMAVFQVSNTANPTNCSINSFTASPTSITRGQASTLNWSTSNCTNVTISNLGYNVPVYGSQQVWPTHTTTYTLNAENSNGVRTSAQVTVYVNENNNDTCYITNFRASPTSITRGDSSTLDWDTTGCSDVTISHLGYNVPLSGSQDVYPNSTTTYTLNAIDSNGIIRDTADVRVTIRSSGGGSVVCDIDSFTTSDTQITLGEPVTLRWNTSYCTDVEISGIGNVSLDGSRVVYPRGTTTFTLNASRNSNVRSQSVTIYTNQTPSPVYNSNVVTTVATNISQNSAQLNGLITNSNYVNTGTYFEYGTTVGLGMRTSSKSTSGNTNFSEFVSGLSPNTIYYFRAASEGSSGVSFGAIEVFRTLGYVVDTTNIQTVKQVIVQGTTVTGSQSPIMLRIENKYQAIGVGDIIDYVVFYKNISSSTLVHPMVQVFIPQGITLLNSSRGTYSEENKTLSVPIEDLVPNAEGVIYMQARVDSLESTLAQIVTTTVLVYTNPNGAQENAMAYVLNNPKINGSVLGASALFGGIFGMSLIGWLILIIFIMLLILVARTFYSRSTNTPSNHI